MVPGVSLLYREWDQADLKEPVPLVALAAQMWIHTNPGFLSPCSSSAVSSRGSMPRVFRLVSHIPRGSSQVSAPPRTPEIQVKLETVAMKLRGPGSYRPPHPVSSHQHRRLSLQGCPEAPLAVSPARAPGSGVPPLSSRRARGLSQGL